MAASKQEPIRAKSPTRGPSNEIHAVIEAAFGPEVVTLVDAIDPYTLIKDRSRFLDLMRFLKETPALSFDFLRSVTGVDWPSKGSIESVYHLFSMKHGRGHVVKAQLPRALPQIPSVEALWPTANWFERETFDLFGIVYESHSDLRRIMLPEDWIGHPLRKDYHEAPDYHGIGTTRASPLEAFHQMDEARRAARAGRGEPPPTPKSSPITPPEGWVDPKAKKAGAAAKAKGAPTTEGGES